MSNKLSKKRVAHQRILDTIKKKKAFGLQEYQKKDLERLAKKKKRSEALKVRDEAHRIKYLEGLAKRKGEQQCA